MKFQDLTGQQFDKLTILHYVGKNRTGQSRWLCRCDCGTEKIIAAHHLKSGNTKSCGCLNTGEARAKASTIHGGVGTPEYESYCAAKKRCNPERTEEFPDHAGRGIEFRYNNFKQLLADLGPRA